MRLLGLDIARFLAFCGMVFVNFRIAAEVTPGTDVASLLTNGLEGRAAALFVVLAGVGLAMGSASRSVTLARAIFLFLLGLLNLTIFEADILHFYALYFVIALPFLSAPPKRLVRAAVGAILVGLLGLFFLDYEANWNWETLEYADFWTVEGFLRHSFFNGWHPVFPWVAFVFVGMWIGRQDLRNSQVQNSLILAGGLVAALAYVPGQVLSDPDLAQVFGSASIPPGPFYILGASGSAAIVIGLILRLEPVLNRLGIAEWLAIPGRMALTLYVAHILLGMGTLEAMGQLDGSLTPQEIFGYSLGFCALSAILTWVWNMLASQGPLETLMRKSTGWLR